MRAIPLTILSVFAHPDDEIGVGSTLARYSDAGVLTVLVCASRGEAATIYCEDCATPENLADVRTHELECACRQLGVAELRWLDWPDGGIPALPREAAIHRIVALIRSIRPDVILTHPENGLYPHPDHLAIWEIVRAAYDAAADPGQYPAAGEPWAASRLYTRALPQSFFDAAPDFAAYRVELNGTRLPFYATPDEAIDVTMLVTPWADRRMAAWDCHTSQHNPDSGFARMPDGLRREMAENEFYQLVAARVPLPEGESHDLLAGLAGEEPPPGESGPTGSAYAPAVYASLAAQRGYLAAYDEYQRQGPKAEFRALLQVLAELQHEAVYSLAGALRRLDGTAAGVEPDQRVVAQALACKTEGSRTQFLRVSAQNAVTWYQGRVDTTTNEDERAMWDELRAAAEKQLSAICSFAST